MAWLEVDILSIFRYVQLFVPQLHLLVRIILLSYLGHGSIKVIYANLIWSTINSIPFNDFRVQNFPNKTRDLLQSLKAKIR